MAGYVSNACGRSILLRMGQSFFLETAYIWVWGFGFLCIVPFGVCYGPLVKDYSLVPKKKMHRRI